MSLLAVTSTQGWMRRLGSKWQRLHQAIYLIGSLAILHYWWHKAGKNDLQTVMIYAAVLAALLLWRLVRWRIAQSRTRA
jgi:sulfoxide reductase heme-binding subunit YedZ